MFELVVNWLVVYFTSILVKHLHLMHLIILGVIMLIETHEIGEKVSMFYDFNEMF